MPCWSMRRQAPFTSLPMSACSPAARPVRSWTEVGPLPEQGAAAGYLPNVAVTALRMFNSGGTKKLRASTYGRGLWEFTLTQGPDFQFTSSANVLTAFAGQSAIFSATLQAITGFTSAVNFSCTRRSTAPPPTCMVAPAEITPSGSGAGFTVTASGSGWRLPVQRSRCRNRREPDDARFRHDLPRR